MAWSFVDDTTAEARAIADAFGRAAPPLDVQAISPAEARSNLLSGASVPDGVLIDVDLSAITGEKGSGPGIAQDIRVGQRAGRIREYPVVRFAGRARVLQSVSGDPGSDDLFDLKIQKESAARDYSSVSNLLGGLTDIYRQLVATNLEDDAAVCRALALDPETAERWCHRGLIARLRANRHSGVHVAAGTLLRSCLLVDGLVIPEDLLAARLGVSRVESQGWPTLREGLAGFRYGGIGSRGFHRWWARGLDEWWLEFSGSERSLLSLTIEERVAALSLHFDRLVPLQMAAGSAGQRPWSRCTIHAEIDPPEFVAVDPIKAVRVRPIADVSAWTDAFYASRGAALRAERDDPRLDRVDLATAKVEGGGG